MLASPHSLLMSRGALQLLVYPLVNANYVHVRAKVTREGTREGSHRHKAEHTRRVL